MEVFASKNQSICELLAHAARKVWGWQTLPELDRRPGGKPFFPARPDCHFNLSHSPPLALCALDDSPVGADIQRIKTTWREGLPPRVCSGSQLEWLEEQPDRWQAFTLLWCLKEARVKYTGTGLRTDIRHIPIPIPHPGQTLYLCDGLYFRIYSGTDWQAALCGEAPPPEFLTWV